MRRFSRQLEINSQYRLHIRPTPQIPAGDVPFQLLAKVARAHQRMVLGVAWAPSDVLFATASRDCSVKLWAMTSSGDVLSTFHQCFAGVTR